MNNLGKIATKGAEGKFFNCKSVWPFDLFPDTIELDEQKLVVTQRSFLTKKIIPVKFENLFNIEVLEAPLFCTVRVISKFVTGGQVDVAYVRKKDAYKLHDRVLALQTASEPPKQSGGQ